MCDFHQTKLRLLPWKQTDRKRNTDAARDRVRYCYFFSDTDFLYCSGVIPSSRRNWLIKAEVSVNPHSAHVSLTL